MANIMKTSLKRLSILFIILAMITLATPVSALAFKDVSNERWSYHSIEKLVELGILNGFPDQTFRPTSNLTRAQGAIIIGKALNIDTNQTAGHNFSDVNERTVGYEFIHALTNIGIFDRAEQFQPTKPLTRAQMAKILVHAFSLKEKSNQWFSDVPTNHWAYTYVQTLVGSGITTGTSNTTFSPNQAVTREQMATFIDRTLNYLTEKQQADEQKIIESPLDQMAVDILALTNEERQKAGLPSLKLHQGAQNLAMIKAKDLHDNEYFDHTSPVYGTPFDMMKGAGLNYKTAGENIAAGYTDAPSVIDGWMNSPGHRANVLNPEFTHLGVGYYKGDNAYKTYYVQMFITPR